ncbi:MAG: hypothetical protein F9K32_19555 [Desulfobulbaceae bacterium]|nr:MAG: hypothetical protein F9K32_19555 [Desulfobulbaceae bacterium]
MPIRLIPLVLLVLAAGCSRIPGPTTHPFTQQRKMQAVEHWGVLAGDVASRLNRELVVYDYLDTPVFVKQTCGDDATPCQPNQTSTFNEAFRDLLITNLVNYGIQTRSTPDERALTVNYKVQVVYHRGTRIRSYFPGTFTMLSAAVLVLREAPDELIALAGGGLLDLVNSAYTDYGHYEILITTSIVNAGRYVFRTSDIYYINDDDFWQYQENMAQPGIIQLTGPTAAIDQPARKQQAAMTEMAPADSAEADMQTPPESIVIPEQERTVIEPAPLEVKPETAKPDADI